MSRPSPFLASEAQETHFRGDAVWGGADEEEPLGQEICDEDKVLAVRYGLHELVPCEDEVRKHEEHCSKGEEAAALQECKQQHDADKAGVDGYAGADDSGFCGRDYACENYGKQNQDTECNHEKISFHLRREFLVAFDLCEISFRKIYYVHHVRDREAAHLSEKVSAGSEIVADGGQQKCQSYLPWAQPEGGNSKYRYRKSYFVGNIDG